MKYCFWLAVLFFMSSSSYADSRENPKFSEQAEARAKVLRKKISEEISSLKGRDWAGRYYAGDGLGLNVSRLDIAPKNGFVFTLHGCGGLYDRNFGGIRDKKGVLSLSFEMENEREVFLAKEYLPIRWGERLYLIPPSEIIEFCNAINYGYEPSKTPWGSFLLRDGDSQKKVTGIPSLPKKFRAYILPKPIDTIVTEVIKVSPPVDDVEFYWSYTTVKLNVGKKQGVLQGMRFHFYKPNDLDFAAVSKIFDESCEAVLTQIVIPDSGEKFPSPKKGWKLSTASTWKETETSVNTEKGNDTSAKK